MAKAGAAQAAKIHNMTEQEREFAAMELWDHEKGTATFVIIMGWFAKVSNNMFSLAYALSNFAGYRSISPC